MEVIEKHMHDEMPELCKDGEHSPVRFIIALGQIYIYCGKCGHILIPNISDGLMEFYTAEQTLIDIDEAVREYCGKKKKD